ncbi:hypothetical protein ROHU_004124 [Labeo rohita]|uniref:Uncharacterized protein n=1 Tax=Labeo rohita TaxID=84645 RepID=A0A498NQ92_LABRO|nr:hypothetical protein ROHU_004124 [Labeo rohita]
MIPLSHHGFTQLSVSQGKRVYGCDSKSSFLIDNDRSVIRDSTMPESQRGPAVHYGDGPCGGHETEIAWVALGGFIGHYVEDIASKNLADFWSALLGLCCSAFLLSLWFYMYLKIEGLPLILTKVEVLGCLGERKARRGFPLDHPKLKRSYMKQESPLPI